MWSDGANDPLPLGLRAIGFSYLNPFSEAHRKRLQLFTWQTANCFGLANSLWDSRELNTSPSKQSLKALSLSKYLQGTNITYPDLSYINSRHTGCQSCRRIRELQLWYLGDQGQEDHLSWSAMQNRFSGLATWILVWIRPSLANAAALHYSLSSNCFFAITKLSYLHYEFTKLVTTEPHTFLSEVKQFQFPTQLTCFSQVILWDNRKLGCSIRSCGALNGIHRSIGTQKPK